MNKSKLGSSQSIRDLYVLDLLPIRDDELTSVYPFRGFTPEIVRIAPLITWILRQPYHGAQHLMQSENLLRHRICGAGSSLSVTVRNEPHFFQRPPSQLSNFSILTLAACKCCYLRSGEARK